MSSGDMAFCPYRMGTGDQKCDQGCFDYPRCLDLGEPTEAEREECRQRMSGGRDSSSSDGGRSVTSSGHGSVEINRHRMGVPLDKLQLFWSPDGRLILSRLRVRRERLSYLRWRLAGPCVLFGRLLPCRARVCSRWSRFGVRVTTNDSGRHGGADVSSARSTW